MDVQIKRWGNGLGFRIPYQIAQQLGLDENSVVELTTAENVLIVTPNPQASKLNELLAIIQSTLCHNRDSLELAEWLPSIQQCRLAPAPFLKSLA